MEVKICGITRVSDLKVAEKYGADYIGFINVKRSPRFVNIEKIKHLLSHLKNKNKAVLVLEPKTVKEVIDKYKQTGIKNIQLHSLSPKDIENLKEYDLRIIRAIGISNNISKKLKNEIIKFSKLCDALLLDYKLKGKTGGTGIEIPFNLAKKASKIAKNANKNLKVYIAGGMSPKKVKSKQNIFKMFFDGVDFNSSLESSPGIKIHKKIIEAINSAKKC